MIEFLFAAIPQHMDAGPMEFPDRRFDERQIEFPGHVNPVHGMSDISRGPVVDAIYGISRIWLFRQMDRAAQWFR